MSTPRFVIVRHGNTFEANESPRRIGASTDIPLTVQGVRQAMALGELFAGMGWNFGRVLVSPLKRTQETTRLILEQFPRRPQPEVIDWLNEIDHGPDENQTEDAVLARIGPAALADWDEHALPPPGWSIDAEKRIAGWQGLFGNDNTEAVLVVTSNGAARFALLADPALRAQVPGLASLKLPTGGYGIINRSADSELSLCAWGKRP